MKIGIIGYGRFGQLLAAALTPFAEICVHDVAPVTATDHKKIIIASLAEIAAVDILFLTVPISTFATVCQQIKNHLTPSTLVVDCCSVKVYPANIMRTTFSSDQPIIATHPLFGPDSAKRNQGLAGLKIVVCPIQHTDKHLQNLTHLFEQLGLNILLTTPDDHDQQMASSQGLVHFIGRGLASLNLHTQELATPDFQSLLNINQMVIHDSWQLFLDMHRYNPYTKAIRQTFMQALLNIDNEVG